MTHVLMIQEPWFHHIAKGTKKIEGRCGLQYAKVKIGDTLEFQCNKNEIVRKKVIRIIQYANFEKMLVNEHLAEVLPGILDIRQGIAIYTQFYPLEKQEANGVFAFELV